MNVRDVEIMLIAHDRASRELGRAAAEILASCPRDGVRATIAQGLVGGMLGPRAVALAHEYAEREMRVARCVALGATLPEVERYEAVVWRMATTSTYANHDVMAAGWQLAERRLLRGEALAPESPGAWSMELLDVLGSPALDMLRWVTGISRLDPLHYEALSKLPSISAWVAEAERQWQ